MNTKNVIIHTGTGRSIDVEIPVDISADSLIKALFSALHLPGKCPSFIRSENPVALICGEQKVAQFGIRDGSSLYI